MKTYKTLWVTKTGDKVKIKEMTDSHLLNTIKFLERWAENQLNIARSSVNAAWASCNGDMAEYCLEQEMDFLAEADAEDYLMERTLCYETMLIEASNRGILNCETTYLIQ